MAIAATIMAAPTACLGAKYSPRRTLEKRAANTGSSR